MNTLRHCVSAGEPLNEEVLLVFQGLRGDTVRHCA